MDAHSTGFTTYELQNYASSRICIQRRAAPPLDNEQKSGQMEKDLHGRRCSTPVVALTVKLDGKTVRVIRSALRTRSSNSANCASAAVETSSPPAAAPPLITITDAALKNLKRLREDAGNDNLLLRMGVRSGGCSGVLFGPCSFLLDHAPALKGCKFYTFATVFGHHFLPHASLVVLLLFAFAGYRGK